MKKQVLLSAGVMLIWAFAAVAGINTRSGKVYCQNSQWSEAVRVLLLAVEEDQKDDEAHFYLGFAYSNLDSVELAYKHFTIAKELNPKKKKDADTNIQSNYARHYKAGQVSFSQSNFTGAAREFKLATLSDPNQSSAHYNLAVTYSRLAPSDSSYVTKTLEEADKVLALADPKEANYTNALQLAARQLVILGREEEAIGRFEKYLAEDPSRYTTVEKIGTDLLNESRWPGAAVFLKMAAETRLSQGQEDFTVYFNIGRAEYNMGATDPTHYDESIVWYEKALTLQPDDANTALNLMAVYIKKEDWASAALWGEKYVSVNPSDAKGWQLLARSYGELGDDAKAVEALARYEQLKE